jgi:hypothetical protein
MNVGDIGHQPEKELHAATPIVLFTVLPNGWASWPWHTQESKLAACQRVKGVWYWPLGSNTAQGRFAVNHFPPHPIPPIPDTPTPG